LCSICDDGLAPIAEQTKCVKNAVGCEVPKEIVGSTDTICEKCGNKEIIKIDF
jgi:hypothetical protein